MSAAETFFIFGAGLTFLTTLITFFLVIWDQPRRDINWLFAGLVLMSGVFTSLWTVGILWQFQGLSFWFTMSSLLAWPAMAMLFHLILKITWPLWRAGLYLAVAIYIISISALAYFLIFKDLYLSEVAFSQWQSLNLPMWNIGFWWSVLGLGILGVLIGVILITALIKAVKTEQPVSTINRIIYLIAATFLWWLPVAGTGLIHWWPGGVVLPAWFAPGLILLFHAALAPGVLNPKELSYLIVKFLSIMIMVAVLVTGVFYLNVYLHTNLRLPMWLIPSWFSILAVIILGVFWYRLRQSDVMKYEFITVVTHKFRTPLTRIRWSAESLKMADSEEERKSSIEEINYSTEKLVELTNVLVDLGKIEGVSYQYQFAINNLVNIVQEVYRSAQHRIEEKEIDCRLTYDASYTKVWADKQRLAFALQILFENAISYTPRQGSIQAHVSLSQESTIFTIKDSGIGIAAKELPLMFSKFYRTEKAKVMDPDGMGIGLYMAKQIIERHGGRLSVDSPGPNKGTIFKLTLPRPQ